MEGIPTQENVKKIDWKDLPKEHKDMLILDISEAESINMLIKVIEHLQEKMDNIPPVFDSVLLALNGNDSEVNRIKSNLTEHKNNDNLYMILKSKAILLIDSSLEIKEYITIFEASDLIKGFATVNDLESINKIKEIISRVKNPNDRKILTEEVAKNMIKF